MTFIKIYSYWYFTEFMQDFPLENHIASQDKKKLKEARNMKKLQL